MNEQELGSLLRQILTLAGGLLAGAGYMDATQANTITNDLVVAIPALVSLGSVAWSIYAHWNMKKVPGDATALELPRSTTIPAVGKEINLTPMTGLAKVVG
jgi:hypothetical protein